MQWEPKHYDNLPIESSHATTELGYELASKAIDLLIKHNLIVVTTRPHQSSNNLRTMIEGICRNPINAYVSKGDVYSALTEKGFDIKPARNGKCSHYASAFNIRIVSGIWDVLVNGTFYYKFPRKTFDNYQNFATEWHSESQKIKELINNNKLNNNIQGV